MMTPRQGSPLYERDPQAWLRHLAEGNRTQPRKRVAAEVLIHGTAGHLLLVDPSYKPGWDVPGGMAEANEPPLHAARRELHEELGLTLDRMALLCVDWVAPHGPWDDLLVFVFDGRSRRSLTVVDFPAPPGPSKATNRPLTLPSARTRCGTVPPARRVLPRRWARCSRHPAREG